MSEENKETFTYTYSAQQQAEIQKIRKKYSAGENTAEDKMEQLRMLDRSVTKKGSVISLIIGVLGALIMGFGMSLIMTDLAAMLGLTRPFIPGVAIGVIGMVGVIAAWPLYQRITAKERERIAPEIIRLADELSE